MNKNENSHGFAISVTTLVITAVVVLLVSISFLRAGAYHKGVKYMELQAVKEGLAEYRPDEEGNPTFIWKK